MDNASELELDPNDASFLPDLPEAERVRPRARPRRMLTGFGAFALGLLALGLAGKLHQRSALAETARDQGRPTMVSVVQPRRSEQVPAVVLPATLEPMQETVVYARTSGYLKKVYVDIGDRVDAGQLLAQIESPEVDESLREARARADQERASLVLAGATRERIRQLFREELVSRQQLDEQEAAFETRRSAVEAAEATAENLAKQQGFQRVAAPFAGTVTARHVDLGALITAGSGQNATSLFTIGQTGGLRVFIDVPQTAAVGIEAGQSVQVSLRERPGKVTEGRVVRTAGALDPRSRTLRTEVRLPNTDRTLLPGMYVQVAFPAASGSPALLVPANTLVIRAEGAQVAAVEGGAVRYRKVALGRDFGREVEVVSGLNGEESLVASPSDRLTDGETVQVAPSAGKGD
jgi:membrane fusion protein, multidrug efflux system